MARAAREPGFLLPFSQRVTVTRVTPNRRANSSWLSPSCFRARLILSAVMYQWYTARAGMSRLARLRPAGGGITGEQAREICFPFDQFFAIEHQDPQNPAAWVPILDRIEAEIESK